MADNSKLTEEERAEIREQFSQIDTSGNGFIDLKELKDALDSVGYKLPQWKIRCMMDEYYDGSSSKHGRGVNGNMNGDSRKNGISLTEFEELCASLKAQQVKLCLLQPTSVHCRVSGQQESTVNGNMDGDSRKNGISLTEFEELCASLKAQQVPI
ncbi:hypothetical protein NE865_02425 [Phthorimaea operculella]|nr:hypothetical protein NE865_02425 [Phthorimaea operculella]